jgi:hypothetical protein
MAEKTYNEQIAEWRQQRAHEQISSRVEEIKTEYQEAVTERDRLVAEGQIDEAAYWDDSVQRLDAEYQQYVPPQQPQVHPQWQTWIRRNSAFIEREGQRGVQAVTDALAYMQRPRTQSNDPKYTGMGLTPQQIFTPQGMKKLEDLLETHGQQYYGIKYDVNEKTLTPNQAARISGLSADAYNNAARQLAAQGRFTKR